MEGRNGPMEIYKGEVMEEEVRKALENHEKRITTLEGLFKSDSEKIKKQISIKEFILSKKPIDDVQKTLVIGYYLEKYRNIENFNAKDLENGFREAKEKVPDNINYKAIRTSKTVI
jgi:hypothetical protein